MPENGCLRVGQMAPDFNATAVVLAVIPVTPMVACDGGDGCAGCGIIG